jgi:hypothetical protein
LDLGADVEDLSEPRNRRLSPSVLVLVPLAVSLVWDPLFDVVHRRRGVLVASPGALRDSLKGAEPRSYSIDTLGYVRMALGG